MQANHHKISPLVLRGNYPVAFLLFDLDHFKGINDTYGHHAGDEALKSVANLLATHTRPSDYVCRYGGEEFLLIMPETNPNDASRRAEALRGLIEKVAFDYESQPLALSASIGVAIYPLHGNNGEMLLKHVDAALYQAKETGRNQVVVYHNHSSA